MEPLDLQLLRVIQKFGPTNHHRLTRELGERAAESLARCRARELVIPVRKSKAYYVYDITDLALAVLRLSSVSEGDTEPTPAAGKRGV